MIVRVYLFLQLFTWSCFLTLLGSFKFQPCVCHNSCTKNLCCYVPRVSLCACHWSFQCSTWPSLCSSVFWFCSTVFPPTPFMLIHMVTKKECFAPHTLAGQGSYKLLSINHASGNPIFPFVASYANACNALTHC